MILPENMINYMDNCNLYLNNINDEYLNFTLENLKNYNSNLLNLYQIYNIFKNDLDFSDVEDINYNKLLLKFKIIITKINDQIKLKDV